MIGGDRSNIRGGWVRGFCDVDAFPDNCFKKTVFVVSKITCFHVSLAEALKVGIRNLAMGL